MNNTKQIINNHNRHIVNTLMTPKITQFKVKHATAHKRTNAHLIETASNRQSSTKQPSNVTRITLLKHTSDPQKTTLIQDTETIFCHAKQKNSTKLGKYIWTLEDSNADHSISWHIILSSSSYNSSSKRCNIFFKEKFLITCICHMICHHLTNVTNLYLLTAKETKRCHVTT